MELESETIQQMLFSHLWIFVFVWESLKLYVCVMSSKSKEACSWTLSQFLWQWVQELFITALVHLREKRNNACT